MHIPRSRDVYPITCIKLLCKYLASNSLSRRKILQFPAIKHVRLFLSIDTTHLTSTYTGQVKTNYRATRLSTRTNYFTAPAVIPCTMYFCSARKPITTGILTTIDAAISWFQYTLLCVA